MEKKCFVALLMVVVMMCACWTWAVADEERETFTSGKYEYALLDDDTVEITSYYGNAEKLTIPDTLDGRKVTSIGDNRGSVFGLCKSLTSVTIPDSVTAIGNLAFTGCKSLTSITISDSVAQIGVNPFLSCSTLKSISVSPEQPYFATIDGVLFRKADKLLIAYPAGSKSSAYTIPQGITAIGDYAFSWCSSLTSVTIPDSVASIGNRAFLNCDSLTSIGIPDSVMQIGVNPFLSCSALKSISVPPDQPYFAAIDGVLFRKADKLLIAYPAGSKSSTFTIPQGITAIGDYAFSWCKFLTSVTIPSSVITIGDSAFYSCDSLTSITIPNSVTSIGDGAFSLCSSLTSVTIPDSVTAIGDYAFYSCSNLILTVPRNSYAAEYAKTNNIPYTYPDANDWLNN